MRELQEVQKKQDISKMRSYSASFVRILRLVEFKFESLVLREWRVWKDGSEDKWI